MNPGSADLRVDSHAWPTLTLPGARIDAHKRNVRPTNTKARGPGRFPGRFLEKLVEYTNPVVRFTTCAPTPARRSSTPRHALKTYMRGCRSERHFADAIYATHRKPRKQALLFNALLRTIASDLVPLRPNRCEPRARKRRPKNYQLLTKSRHQMRTAPHRNRPKNHP
jgi:hypothetical protein